MEMIYNLGDLVNVQNEQKTIRSNLFNVEHGESYSSNASCAIDLRIKIDYILHFY